MDRVIRLLEMSHNYKEQYDECVWWKFNKRNKLYKSWLSGIDLAMEYMNDNLIK